MREEAPNPVGHLQVGRLGVRVVVDPLPGTPPRPGRRGAGRQVSLRTSSDAITIASMVGASAWARVDFPVPGSAAHQGARRRDPPEVLDGQGQAAARGVPRRVHPRPDRGDLRPDQGAGGHVEVGQRSRVVLAGELPVVGQPQERGEVGRAQALEVHREERDVGEHVAVAQPVVELDAVEDAWPVGEAEDVVREQVAVAVAHEAIVNPLVEERPAPAQVGAAERLDLVDQVGVEHAGRHGACSADVGGELRGHGLGCVLAVSMAGERSAVPA